MKKLMTAALLAAPSVALWAALPTVSGIAVSQNDDTRLVAITYTFTGDTPAIVTADILTNGVSVGAVSALSGDVNKLLVPTGGTCTAYWQPRIDLPGTVLDANAVTANLTVWDPASPPDYMAVDLTVTNSRTFYPSAGMVPGGVTNRLYKTDVLLMRKIPAAGAEFIMGTPHNFDGVGRTELGRASNELLPHAVTMTNDYYIGVFELTYRQFRRIVASAPSYYSFGSDSMPEGADVDVLPVTGFRYHQWRTYLEPSSTELASYIVGWPQSGHQIVKTNNAYLVKFRAATGLELDFPTEAQWEFACRAGSSAALYTGEEITNRTVSAQLDAIAWYAGNWSNDTARLMRLDGAPLPHEVGLLKPNAYGLYDMLGNVYECCLDVTSLSGNEAMGTDEVEPVGLPAENCDVRHAIRGGAFNCDAYGVRAGYRLALGTSATASTWNLDSSIHTFFTAFGYTDKNNMFNLGVRLACPAAIPVPATAEEGD